MSDAGGELLARRRDNLSVVSDAEIPQHDRVGVIRKKRHAAVDPQHPGHVRVRRLDRRIGPRRVVSQCASALGLVADRVADGGHAVCEPKTIAR